jgi:hypothetical protein
MQPPAGRRLLPEWLPPAKCQPDTITRAHPSPFMCVSAAVTMSFVLVLCQGFSQAVCSSEPWDSRGRMERCAEPIRGSAASGPPPGAARGKRHSSTIPTLTARTLSYATDGAARWAGVGCRGWWSDAQKAVTRSQCSPPPRLFILAASELWGRVDAARTLATSCHFRIKRLGRHRMMERAAAARRQRACGMRVPLSPLAAAPFTKHRERRGTRPTRPAAKVVSDAEGSDGRQACPRHSNGGALRGSTTPNGIARPLKTRKNETGGEL